VFITDKEIVSKLPAETKKLSKENRPKSANKNTIGKSLVAYSPKKGTANNNEKA
jgi:hypothetical protein